MRNYFLLAFLFAFQFGYAQVELITQTRQRGAITWITYSPQGNYVASANGGDNNIRIWDVRSGKNIGALTGHENTITALQFLPNGEQLVSADLDGFLMVWDLNTWKVRDSLDMDGQISSIATQEKFIFAASKKGGVHVLDHHLKELNLFATGKDPVHEVIANKNSGEIAVHILNKEIQIWDVNTAKKKVALNVAKEGITFLQFSSAQQLICASSSGKISIWNTNDKKKTSEIQAHPNAITAMDVNVSKGFIATASNDKRIRISSANDLSEIQTFITANEKTHEEAIRALSFSPDGNALASSGFKVNTILGTSRSDNTIRLWSLPKKALFKELQGSVKPIIAFAFYPLDNKVAILSEGQELSFWDFDLGEKTGTFQLPEAKREYYPETKRMTENAVNNIGGTFNSAKNIMDGNINLNKKNTAKTVGKATQRNLKNIVEQDPVILFSNKGNLMVTHLPKDEIRVYDISGGKPVYKYFVKHELQKVNTLAISPDDKFIVCGGIGQEFVTICDLNTGAFKSNLAFNIPTATLAISEVRDMSFSPDGKFFAAVFNTGKLFVLEVASGSVVFENLMPVNPTALQGGFVNFSRDSKYILYNSFEGFKKVNIQNFIEEKAQTIAVKGRILQMNNPQDFAIGRERDHLNVYNLINGKSANISGNSKEITCIDVSASGRMAVSFISGELKIYDPNEGQYIATMVTEGDNAIIKTKDNFYKVNKEGYGLVTFRVGKNAYPFEQFDLYFNQPARVLEALGSKNKGLIQLYQTTRDKRMKKMGLEKSFFAIDALPQIEVLNRNEIPSTTSDKQITLHIKATDPNGKITGLQFWVNNVPVFGTRNIKTRASSSVDTNIVLPLLNGINEIRCAAFNQKGNESLNEAFRIDASYSTNVNLFLVSIGTSSYKDKKFNLKYAAKDAKDLAAMMGGSSLFSSVQIKTLTDAEVTKKNLQTVKDFLAKAEVNDIVMVFIAGHGVLDKDFNYFYAPHLMDFMNPAKEGISYESLEGLISQIKAIRKILIMDTCHSGEVDKEEVTGSTAAAPIEKGEVEFRGAGDAVEYKDAQSAGASKMMKELFTDLRKGTGATAISSAGGTELAMESDAWKNGLFTYCLLSGLKEKTADKNQDGQITLSELQAYLVTAVTEKSQGRQVPTTRVENFMLDYSIWK
jgi:WD40 repeat protein